MPSPVPAGGSGAVPGDLDRVWVYGSIAAAIDRIAEGRAVVLVVDDLHWADRTTLEFLDYQSSVSRSHLGSAVLTAVVDHDHLVQRRPWQLTQHKGQAFRFI